jgi:hypothetical protein
MANDFLSMQRRSPWLAMEANDVFGFCCARGWDPAAFRFWHGYKAASRDLRILALLGSPNSRGSADDALAAREAGKHVLSDAVRDEYCKAQAWDQQDLHQFLEKLHGKR